MKIKAHAPVQQYGFIEIEGDEKDLPEIKKVYNELSEHPVKWDAGLFKEIKTFTDEVILYDDLNHKYTDLQGNKLVSGSEYASSLKKPFNMDAMLPRTAKSWGVDEKMLKELWEGSGEIGRTFGTAMHKALELYIRYKGEGAAIAKDKKKPYNYALPKHPVLREIVEDFDELYDVVGADRAEVFVSDVKNKRVGQIDLLRTSLNVHQVCDFKFNGELKDEDLDNYAHQLSFYTQILKDKGFNVAPPILYHWNGEWKEYELELKEIK